MKHPCSLKLVILYDPRDETYTVVEHNLESVEAAERVAAMRTKRLPAFTVTQTTRHREPEATRCKACKRDVRKMFAVPHAKPKEEKKRSEDRTT